MSYLVFARKYRPQDFSQVIGQEGIVRRLIEAINTKRVHQAYLFSGPRGVGKTSLARILAKALNCQSFSEPTTKPCGKCTSCVEIQEGRSLDVLEIDGASNRGIEEIRQLRENIKFAPSYCRFKVYIIDEVHQITHDAFNALLKTLEEPPPHVKFIFATTAPHRVPLTILSRCQRFNFNLLSEEEIITKLKFIAKCEGISVEKNILAYIAKASLGSIRDAESIFDQITPLLIEGAKFEDILDILGQIPEYKIYSFIDSLLKKQTDSLLSLINNIVEEGYDLDNFVNGVIDYVRSIILAKVGEEVLRKVADLSPELQKRILELSQVTDLSFLIKVIESLIEVKKTGRIFPSLRVPLEIEVLKLTYSKKETPLKETQEVKAKNEEDAKSSSAEGVMHKSATLNLESLSKFVESLKLNFSHHKVAEDREKSSAESKSVTLEEVEAVWQDLIEEISSTKMSVATYLKEAKIAGTEGRIIKLSLPKNFKFHKEYLENRARKKIVEEALSNMLNKKVGIEYVLSEEVREAKTNSSDIKSDLGKIIKSFDGEILP